MTRSRETEIMIEVKIKVLDLVARREVTPRPATPPIFLTQKDSHQSWAQRPALWKKFRPIILSSTNVNNLSTTVTRPNKANNRACRSHSNSRLWATQAMGAKGREAVQEAM